MDAPRPSRGPRTRPSIAVTRGPAGASAEAPATVAVEALSLDLAPGGAEARLVVWPSPSGLGTPVTWHDDGDIVFAHFGAQGARMLHGGASLEWARRLLHDPTAARELSGAFAVVAVSRLSGETLVVGDRLGIQAIHYLRTADGGWLFSTHLTHLLRSVGHDGAVAPAGFFAHMAFGYGVEPYGEVYAGVRRMSPSSYLRLGPDGVSTGSYRPPPEPAEPTDEQISFLVGALRSSIDSAPGELEPYLGLTAGRDSLCLAAAAAPRGPARSGTLGVPQSADRVQAQRLSAHLGWAHDEAGVCSASELRDWAAFLAYHSAGLTTSSYVDLAAFVGTTVDHRSAFVIGEGGECVRDFFYTAGPSPLERLRHEFMTDRDVLEATLATPYREMTRDYPDGLIGPVREAIGSADDGAFLLDFYRLQRMPGAFSLRNAVLAPLRPRISPFLDAEFIDGSYGMPVRMFEGSGLHRALIAGSRPELLTFFDHPVTDGPPTQDWPARFSGDVGIVVHDLLEDSLPHCEDVLDAPGVLELCRATAVDPTRAMYHLFRVLSFALGRAMIRRGSTPAGMAVAPRVLAVARSNRAGALSAPGGR